MGHRIDQFTAFLHTYPEAAVALGWAAGWLALVIVPLVARWLRWWWGF